MGSAPSKRGGACRILLPAAISHSDAARARMLPRSRTRNGVESGGSPIRGPPRMSSLLLRIGTMAVPADGPWAMWTGIVLSAVALVFCGILYFKLRRRNPETAAGDAVPDVLGVVLKRSQVPESDGVRW